MLHLCGLLAEAFPDIIKSDANRLLRIYLSLLKTHMASGHHSKVVVINGCFLGLNGFLTASPQVCDPALLPGQPGSGANEVYRYLRMAFNPKSVEKQTRFEPCWRALEVFAKHARLFRPWLPVDFQSLFNDLFALCDNHNKDVKASAFRALEAFLHQASLYIMSNPVSDSSRGMFQNLMQRMLTTLRDTNAAGARATAVAIRGCGYLAGPCLKLQVSLILNNVSFFPHHNCF